MKEKTPIAIFASGRGSNFQAILDAIDSGKLSARVTALVSDQKGALVIERARARKIPTIVVEPKGNKTSDREVQEKEIFKSLSEDLPEFLVLAGYLRVLSPWLIQKFWDSKKGTSRIVNIHPSLLPAFPGIQSYAKAFQYGCQVSGVSVHFVDESLDSGPICAQEAFSMGDCQTVEEVEKRGLAIEHRLYPQTLSWIFSGEYDLEPRVWKIRQQEVRRLGVRPH